MAEVAFHNVSKVFAEGAVAVDDLTATIEDGEFMVLVGPSGCGKTTALRMVAGLEDPTSGAITIAGEVVNDRSPRDRDIAMVFQNYALYPHMTVQKNLAFGLRQRKVPAEQVRTRVAEVSRMLGLDELLQRRPAQLSGGQRQRVAMGRALARDPKAFLLDEPLSNLDAKLRMQLRAELKKLHQTVGTTAIYVTHDQVEAMTLGDRIAVMSGGVLQQLGPPQEVYSRPSNLFVAGFIGSPPMNLLAGTAREGEVRFGPLSFMRPGVPDGEVVIGLRPEALAPAGGEGVQVELTVEIVEPLGNEVVVHGTVPGRTAGPAAADAVEGRAHVIARLGAATRLAPGQLVRLAFDPAGAHLFDPADGLRIDR